MAKKAKKTAKKKTAKKNVRNTIKKLGGRPPMFKTAEELQAKIDEYFKTGVKKKSGPVGKGANATVMQIPVPTITGLVLYLGFCDRQSFYDYEKIPKFTCIVKRARTFIECEYEQQLQVGNTVGAIFALKNMGWKDKIEQEHGVTDGMADLLKEIGSSGIGLPIKT